LQTLGEKVEKRHSSHYRIFFRLIFFQFSLLFFSLSVGCDKAGKPSSDAGKDYVVIAIPGDIDSFNPLFAEEVVAGEISELLFPGLVDSRFDTTRGVLEYHPRAAKSWEFANENRDLIFHLRSDAKWSDGVPVTARDVQLSYELYGDPVVASVRQSSVEGLRKSKGGLLDVRNAIEIRDDSTVVFHFQKAYPSQLFDAGLPILPAHIFEGLPRKGLREHPVNRNPISAGPFLLKSWKPLQEIVLVPNPTSSLPKPAGLSQLIFRIIPDERSRIAQLRTGEVDLVANLQLDDALELQKSSSHVEIIKRGERIYDALNWNNIDPVEYSKSGGKNLRPHPLFGSPRVRRALTHAIDRAEIVQAYLGIFGRVAIGPVSPLFRWAFNDTLRPLPYDPALATQLLSEEGWRDTNGDGVLDKQGRKFSFVLKIAAGDQLRSSIAAVVQNRLKQLKIEVAIEQVERAAFWADLMRKKYDAWIAGFSVPLQMQLDELWGSDLSRSPFNLVSFRHKRVNEILMGAKNITNEVHYAPAWKELQAIFVKEQPCTFLYWKNDLVGVSRRIRGTDIGVIGVLHHAWEWYVKPEIATRSLSQ